MYYKNVENVYTSYGDKFEYIVMVVNSDNTMQLYYKPVNGEEHTFTTTFELVYNDEGTEITTLKCKTFLRAKLDENGDTVLYEVGTDEGFHNVAFSKTGNLVDKTTNLKDLLDWTKTTKYRAQFKKYSSKITERNLNKAKKSQKEEISNRVVGSTNEPDDSKD